VHLSANARCRATGRVNARPHCRPRALTRRAITFRKISFTHSSPCPPHTLSPARCGHRACTQGACSTTSQPFRKPSFARLQGRLAATDLTGEHTPRVVSPAARAICTRPTPANPHFAGLEPQGGEE